MRFKHIPVKNYNYILKCKTCNWKSRIRKKNEKFLLCKTITYQLLSQDQSEKNRPIILSFRLLNSLVGIWIYTSISLFIIVNLINSTFIATIFWFRDIIWEITFQGFLFITNFLKCRTISYYYLLLIFFVCFFFFFISQFLLTLKSIHYTTTKRFPPFNRVINSPDRIKKKYGARAICSQEVKDESRRPLCDSPSWLWKKRKQGVYIEIRLWIPFFPLPPCPCDSSGNAQWQTVTRREEEEEDKPALE